MASERIGLLTLRVWVEPGSSQPLRANVRFTNDVSEGYQAARVLSDERAVNEAVQTWLRQFAATQTSDQLGTP